MKVILQKDVKDLGKVGDVVNVSQGYARNFLFPRKAAQIATENKVKQWEHLQKVSEIKMKKARSDRQQVIDAVNGINVMFKAQAGDDDSLFGSISQLDISKELEKMGHSVDKKDIQLEEPLKMLGQHKAGITLGEGLTAELVVTIERI